MTTSPVAPAPGGLEFVRRFVNSLDIEAGTDSLSAPDSYLEWAVGLDVDGRVTAEELEGARALRETVREALAANHDRAPLPIGTVEALNAAAEDAMLTVSFSADRARLVPVSHGIAALYGRVVAEVMAAMAEGTWDRLKVCAADDCRWAFYDRSRSRTGQWCSMSICGNRAKQARWRNASN